MLDVCTNNAARYKPINNFFENLHKSSFSCFKNCHMNTNLRNQQWSIDLSTIECTDKWKTLKKKRSISKYLNTKGKKRFHRTFKSTCRNLDGRLNIQVKTSTMLSVKNDSTTFKKYYCLKP